MHGEKTLTEKQLPSGNCRDFVKFNLHFITLTSEVVHCLIKEAIQIPEFKKENRSTRVLAATKSDTEYMAALDLVQQCAI